MILTIVFYLSINIIWCFVGLRWFAPSRSDKLFSTALGFGRTLLWWIFGLFVFYSSMFLQGVFYDAAETLTMIYIFLYIPLIWIQWCIIARFIRRSKSSWNVFLFGASRKEYAWRLFGTVISLVIELPNTFLWSIVIQRMFERGGS